MKIIIGTILLILSFSCLTGKSTIAQVNKTTHPKYPVIQDTIVIATETGDTLEYSKEEFNKIISRHPEFFQEFPESPEQAYYNREKNADEFNSEAGQDEYFILYAYFLKQKKRYGRICNTKKKTLEYLCKHKFIVFLF